MSGIRVYDSNRGADTTFMPKLKLKIHWYIKTYSPLIIICSLAKRRFIYA